MKTQCRESISLESIPSLNVDAAMVVAVLLDDGWHRVTRGSFKVGLLRYNGDPLETRDLRTLRHSERDTPGFTFEDATNTKNGRSTLVAGPLRSIHSVRYVNSR
jgi:hypothetical protein